MITSRQILQITGCCLLIITLLYLALVATFPNWQEYLIILVYNIVAKNKFLTAKYNLTYLNNENVFVEFAQYNKIICTDKKDSSHVIYTKANSSQYFYNLRIKTFLDICYKFNAETTFEDITKILTDNFDVIHKIPKKTNTQKTATKTFSKKTKEKTSDSKHPQNTTKKDIAIVNINLADENELAKLPGINIILAKHIVKFRSEQHFFKDAEEFYKEFNIKPHFQKKLEPQICFNVVNKKKKKQTADERIIDL